jgi:hypothetical protein
LIIIIIFGERAQHTKLLIMQFSPTFCHFISHWSKYSPYLPLPIYPQSTFYVCQRLSFTPIQYYKRNYSFICFNFYSFEQQTRRQPVMNGMVSRITKIELALNLLMNQIFISLNWTSFMSNIFQCVFSSSSYYQSEGQGFMLLMLVSPHLRTSGWGRGCHHWHKNCGSKLCDLLLFFLYLVFKWLWPN